MGTKDYEYLKTKPYKKTNMLDHLSNNMPYLYDLFKYLNYESIGSVINRHVFKFTKLREEIIFVKVRLRLTETSNDASEFVFTVNEQSFWNRFRIVTPGVTGETYSRETINAVSFINLARSDPKSVGKIRLHLLDKEVSKLNTYIESSTESNKIKLKALNIINNAFVEIAGCVHYNKRVWSHLIEKFIANYPTSGKLVENIPHFNLGEDLAKYKVSGSEGFYNPKQEDYLYLYQFYNVPKDYTAQESNEG